jgi:hypothetical protein
MATPPMSLPRPLRRYAEKLSFPRLFLLSSGLFLLTLVIPDPLPFVDEILLGLLTLMVGSVRRRKPDPQSDGDGRANTK